MDVKHGFSRIAIIYFTFEFCNLSTNDEFKAQSF